MDSHSSHADLEDPIGRVKVLEYPPYCTSKHQPMDKGVIAAFKKIYKTRLLQCRVATIADAPLLRQQALDRKMARGTLGLAEGCLPHVLDAMEVVAASWDRFSSVTIER